MLHGWLPARVNFKSYLSNSFLCIHILCIFAVDIAALFRSDNDGEATPTSSTNEPMSISSASKLRSSLSSSMRNKRGPSIRRSAGSRRVLNDWVEDYSTRELDLPTGICEYDENSWFSSDIRRIRRSYDSSVITLPMFESGLIAFYDSKWTHARQCFERVLTSTDDGPSKYFLKVIKENDGVPPPGFAENGIE